MTRLTKLTISSGPKIISRVFADLPDLAVHETRDVERCRVDIDCDVRSERTERVVALATRPLPVLALPTRFVTSFAHV
jgi:hypothetical protein